MGVEAAGVKPAQAIARIGCPAAVPYPPCSVCRAVWYCGTACSHADWRAGHRRVCRALGATRAAERERRRQAAVEAAESSEAGEQAA